MWAVGEAYEGYVGRWSRLVAAQFVRWLRVAPGSRWLDVGCGTGALTETVLSSAEPAEVVGVDPSTGFLDIARSRNPGVTFHTGDARELPLPDNGFDAVVSGLALNFVPDPVRAVAEFGRVARPGGVVAAYVWDYADGMEMMSHFWEAAVALDPETVDERRRFAKWRPEWLGELWSGMDGVSVQAIEIPTLFKDFDDYWTPFLGGQGPAPAYTMSLPEPARARLGEALRERLPASADGGIRLTARAWAIRGTVRWQKD
ncbi:MAG TPA: methyltransferase domain-containing protein [Candidatus Limnocylindrales bacterium]